MGRKTWKGQKNLHACSPTVGLIGGLKVVWYKG